jgi:hypothetical protein
MTDLHLRILRIVAKHRQCELNDHDAADHTGGPASAGHRSDLEQAAGRANANVAAAEARRRYPRPGHAR